MSLLEETWTLGIVIWGTEEIMPLEFYYFVSTFWLSRIPQSDLYAHSFNSAKPLSDTVQNNLSNSIYILWLIPSL